MKCDLEVLKYTEPAFAANGASFHWNQLWEEFFVKFGRNKSKTFMFGCVYLFYIEFQYRTIKWPCQTGYEL